MTSRRGAGRGGETSTRRGGKAMYVYNVRAKRKRSLAWRGVGRVHTHLLLPLLGTLFF